MSGWQGIVLVGIEHTPENLGKIRTLIDRHSREVKTISIEGIFDHEAAVVNDLIKKQAPDEPKIVDIILSIAGVDKFWSELAIYAAGKGLTIVPIDSRHAIRYLGEEEKELKELYEKGKKLISKVDSREITKEKALSELRKLQREKRRKTKKYELVSGALRDEFMVRRVKKRRPDMVIVGQWHSYAIAKAVPVKQRYAIMSQSARKKLYRTRTRMCLRKLQLDLHRKTRAIRRKLRKSRPR